MLLLIIILIFGSNPKIAAIVKPNIRRVPEIIIVRKVYNYVQY